MQTLHNFFLPKNNPSKILKFLGSSDSAGIPVHNCLCQACQSYRQKGARNRATCAYIPLKQGEYLLIDCGLEEIATLFDNAQIQAIFLTHFHPDHALGLLRLRYSKTPITCFCPFDKEGFADLFKHKKSLNFVFLEPFNPITIHNIIFTPIPLKHSKPTFGYVMQTPCEKIAYLSDCAGISEESLDFLRAQKVDIAYLDAGAYNCNGKKDTNNHLDAFEASKILEKISPKQARLFHISHTIASANPHSFPIPYLM